jgi:hypothetical protein
MRESLLRLRRSPVGRLPARVVLLGAIVCCAMALAGCGAANVGSSSGTPPAPPPPAAATVNLCDNATAGCTPSSSFSIGSLREMGIVVAWNNVAAGNHAQKVTLLLPDGHIYQVIETGFRIPTSPSGSFTSVQRLPVAGTFITQRSLTGLWTVQVSLDDAPMTSQTFQLNP